MNKNQLSNSSEEQIPIDPSNQSEIAQLNKVPKFMAFNQHITYGYRLNFNQPAQILKSLFVFHNQTINIWTHLIGALIVFAFIISFFTIVDKAELQYQLKNYQQNLNQHFKNFNTVLHKMQTTLKTFENSQHQSHNKDDLSQFQFQLRTQYKEVIEFVKSQIEQIHKILKQDINLNQEQIKLRQLISQQLTRFQIIQKQLQSSIQAILWANFDEQVYKKAHKIQITRKEVEKLSQTINKNVIQYLQLQKQTPNPYGVSRWPILVFLFTATLCLGFSAVFHLFYPMSSKAFKFFRRFDYAGVILNIVGTGIPPIYYSLYCKPIIATIYLTVMIFFGTVLFVTLLQDWIHKNRNKKYKPIMFGLFGLTYVIPYCHFMISETFFNNSGDPYKFSHSNFWWVTSAFSFLFGLYIFIKKWPQSKYKHKFDFIGSSHQIWHFLVLCGVACTYFAININYQTRKLCSCP